jgi:hypothetical protein
MNNSTGIMKSMRTTKNSAMKEVKLNNSKRVVLVGGDITSMAEQNTDAVISIGGRSWRFPGAHLDTDSWEVEWRGDGRLYLHDGVGEVVEGTEVDNPEERRQRERLLARLLVITLQMLLNEGHIELAVKIETAKDVIREFKHVYPQTMNV